MFAEKQTKTQNIFSSVPIYLYPILALFGDLRGKIFESVVAKVFLC